eukprot:9735081-Heterocapsa_arctica.AAC.1
MSSATAIASTARREGGGAPCQAMARSSWQLGVRLWSRTSRSAMRAEHVIDRSTASSPSLKYSEPTGGGMGCPS